MCILYVRGYINLVCFGILIVVVGESQLSGNYASFVLILPTNIAVTQIRDKCKHSATCQIFLL